MLGNGIKNTIKRVFSIKIEKNVGMTGLEPATSRPPDEYSTN